MIAWIKTGNTTVYTPVYRDIRVMQVAVKTQAAGGTGATTYLKLVDPTENEGESSGYNIGDFWVNTVTDKCFVCLDNTSFLAVWEDLLNTNAGTFT